MPGEREQASRPQFWALNIFGGAVSQVHEVPGGTSSRHVLWRRRTLGPRLLAHAPPRRAPEPPENGGKNAATLFKVVYYAFYN